MPSGGFARTNGTWSAARWTTRVISCSSSTRSSASRSVTSPRTSVHADRVFAEHESQSRGVVPEVVAHDLVPVGERRPRDPGAEAAEDAGDEEPLAHASGASWYTVTRLGEELERRAALLVRAEARSLDPAERDVDVRARGLRVDVEDARLQLLGEALDAWRSRVKIDAESPNRRRSRARAPRRAWRTGRATSPARTPPRTRGRRRRATSSKTRRLDEVAVSSPRPPPASDGAALASPALDRGEDVLERALVDERADLGRGVGRVADLARARRARGASRGTRRTRVLHEDPSRRGALLAGRPERAGVRGLDGAVELGVGHHDQRIVPAELELDAAVARSRRRRGRRWPTATEPVNEIARTSGLSTSAAPTVEPAPVSDVEHARREARPRRSTRRCGDPSAARRSRA